MSACQALVNLLAPKRDGDKGEAGGRPVLTSGLQVLALTIYVAGGAIPRGLHRRTIICSSPTLRYMSMQRTWQREYRKCLKALTLSESRRHVQGRLSRVRQENTPGLVWTHAQI